jgi:hypothetical protein
MATVDEKDRCDCNACEQARQHQISPRTGRVPGTKRAVEPNERDPAVVRSSRRIREEDGR